MADISKWNGLDIKDKTARSNIGNVLLLQTADRTSLVNAINELLARIVTLEENSGGETPIGTSLLNLNRTHRENTSYAWYDETCYMNPTGYSSTNPTGGTPCVVSNLTSNSITVTEGGTGGQCVTFPFNVVNTEQGIDRRGKSFVLTWDATGTTDTRFRLLMGDGSTFKSADLDNKSGTKTSATIDISTDGKTITVNGTAYTFTNAVSWIAFAFSAATGKTVNYTGVKLVEA